MLSLYINCFIKKYKKISLNINKIHVKHGLKLTMEWLDKQNLQNLLLEKCQVRQHHLRPYVYCSEKLKRWLENLKMKLFGPECDKFQ